MNAATVKKSSAAELQRQIVQAFVTRTDTRIPVPVFVEAVKKIAAARSMTVEAVYQEMRNEARSLGAGVSSFEIPGFYRTI